MAHDPDRCCVCGANCDGSLMRTDPRYNRVRALLTASEVPRRRSMGAQPNIALCHACQRKTERAGGLNVLLTRLVKSEAARANRQAGGCPKCGHDRRYAIKRRKTYRCANPACRHEYSARSSTLRAAAKITDELRDAIKGDAKIGMSASELSKKHGVNARTVWAIRSELGFSGKLTHEQRQEIKSLRGVKKLRQISAIYGISESQVSAIQRGVSK